MRQIKLSLITASILLIQSCSVGTKLTTVIPKGKIVNNMSITFIDIKKTIQPETFFQLIDFGIVANSETKKSFVTLHGIGGNYTNNLTNISGCLDLMKRKEIISYDVIVKNLNTNKEFYGKIAFFNAHKAYGYTATNKYYELSIKEDFFTSSTRGRTSISYEYNGDGKAQYPTWIILISDEPL